MMMGHNLQLCALLCVLCLLKETHYRSWIICDFNPHSKESKKDRDCVCTVVVSVAFVPVSLGGDDFILFLCHAHKVPNTYARTK